MRIIGLCVLLLAGLGLGWILGKAVLGRSPIKQTLPAVSADKAAEDKTVTETATTADLEAKADDAQVTSYESQDQKALDERNNRSRNSGGARRTLVTSKARTGPGIGVVARPIKAVFGPLKRVNPLRLRLW